jgi:hypothetical protein
VVAVGSPEDVDLLNWEDEGGSHAPFGKEALPPNGPNRRAPQDTADGCVAMAAADMARAALEPEGWPRIKWEHSAVAWSRRAKLLRVAEKRDATRCGG